MGEGHRAQPAVLLELGAVDGPRDWEVMEGDSGLQMARGLKDREACNWLGVTFQEDGPVSPDPRG